MVDLAKQIQVGQTVRLEMVGNGYQITPLLDESGLAVVAVGLDYIVLDDTESGIKTRIPIHLLKIGEVTPSEPIPQAA